MSIIQNIQMNSEQEKSQENNNKGDLFLEKVKKFANEQKHFYELELAKEQEEMLSLFEYSDIDYFLKKGILINNLKLIERGFTSYGHIQIEFQSRFIKNPIFLYF